VQGIINTVLTILFNVLFLVILPDNNFFNSAYGYVLSIVIADFIVGAFLLIYAKLYRDIKIKHFNRSLAVSMLKYSLPLIPTTIFWWITNVSDRYMVTYFNGSAKNGLYAAAYKIPTILTLVTGVFSEAWQFSAVKVNDEKERSNFYSTVFSCFQALIFVASAAVIAFSRIISNILFASDYYTAWEFIPVLVVSSIFSSFVTFLSSVYMVRKRSVKSFVTSMIGALSNIVLNFIFIPTELNFGFFTMKCIGWGAQGAAIATVISYVIVFIIRVADTGKLLKFDLHLVRLGINSFITVLGVASMLCIKNLIALIATQSVFVLIIFIINVKPLISGIKIAVNSIKNK
jgi:O-antigen/teichoic acid export membrane protein